MSDSEIVITGLGVVSPIGIGRKPFWESLCAGRSGVRRLSLFDPSGLTVQFGGEVKDFDPKPYLYSRKSLKVMARDIQLAVAAAKLAFDDAGLAPGNVDPDRLGVVLGADRICNPVADSEAPYRGCLVDGRFEYGRWGSAGLAASFPLSFLRVLPNMAACHVSIAHDARGPNNSIHQGEVSSLLAVQEAVRVIQRGMADVVMSGGSSSQMDPYDWVRHCTMDGLSRRGDDPAAACRPFDADRDGQVRGEGAAVLVLERQSHALARGATVLARIIGWSSTCEPRIEGGVPSGSALARAIAGALGRTGLGPGDLGHVCAHGLSKIDEDRVEARAIAAAAPGVPVTAPASFFGNLGAAAGASHLAASVLGLACGKVPVTLNYQRPDPECPVEVVRGQALESAVPLGLALSWSPSGQAAAVVVGA